MDGYNVCIFAYGQTGTKKTFTMEGTPECIGVNYRTLEELFRIMKERMSLMRYEFSFSMLEVYNEKIRDLLVDNSDLCAKKLDIKQSAERTLEVPGLAKIQVCNIEEVWEMHKSGGRNRSVGSTNANELSSRSHSKSFHVMKIKDLENQLVEEKKARSQLTFANEMSRSFQPSFKQRPPLARITDRLPPLAPPHKIVKIGLENMENAHSTIKDVTQGFTTKPLGRARRISLSPIVFNISKNKRRASCATELETLAQLSKKHHMNHARVTTKPS